MSLEKTACKLLGCAALLLPKWDILKDAKDKAEVIFCKRLFYLSLCLTYSAYQRAHQTPPKCSQRNCWLTGECGQAEGREATLKSEKTKMDLLSGRGSLSFSWNVHIFKKIQSSAFCINGQAFKQGLNCDTRTGHLLQRRVCLCCMDPQESSGYDHSPRAPSQITVHSWRIWSTNFW